MLKRDNIKKNFVQIIAIAVKEVKLVARFKFGIFLNLGAPLLSIFIPYIIFGALFRYSGTIDLDYYNQNNYILFLFIAYALTYLLTIFNVYSSSFKQEKYWKTLKGLIIAPFNRYNMLMGLLVANLILKSVPTIVILTICYILFPIPPFTFFLFLVVLLCIGIIFSGIGIVVGVFTITNESIAKLMEVGLDFLLYLSCVFYPLKMFPRILHPIFYLNPLYYVFDLLRLIWWSGINFYEALSFITPIHFISLVASVILIPFIGTYLFNKIYNKYGIKGY